MFGEPLLQGERDILLNLSEGYCGYRLRRPSAFRWMPRVGKLSGLPPRLGAMPVKLAPAPKTAEGFYLSPEWRKLVRRLKSERGAFCERCGSSHRVIADHVVERKDGGADLDPANIELLCHACHQRKTARARAKRVRGEG